MKRLALIAAFAAATAAHAQRVAVETRPPYYLDDNIIFSVDLAPNESERLTEDPQNLDIRQFGREYREGTGSRVWYSAAPREAGPARIPPIEIQREGRVSRTLPQVALKIEPAQLSETLDEAALATRLRLTGRPVVTARVLAPATVFTGGVIDVRWTVFSDQTVSGSVVNDTNVGVSMDRGNAARDVLGGVIGYRSNLARRARLAGSPGIIEIPPAMVNVQYQRTGGWTTFHRFAAGATITVLPNPRPDLPIGQFRVSRVQRIEKGALYPNTFRVSIAGTGDLPSRFVPTLKEASFPVVARPGEAGFIDAERGHVEMERDWILELHPKAGATAIPDLSFAYYDPQLQRASELSIALPGSFAQPAKAAAASNPKVPKVLGVVMFGVAGLVFGLVLLIRHVATV